MSTEELVEKFGAQITRRNFLAKLGAGAVGALLGLMGFPNVAAYVSCLRHLASRIVLTLGAGFVTMLQKPGTINAANV